MASKQLWFIFPGIQTNWQLSRDLLLSADNEFSISIQRSAQILARFNVNLTDFLSSDETNDLFHDNATEVIFSCQTALQIALVDLFRDMSFPANGLIGYSIGEFACAYADGCYTAEEALLMSYWLGKWIRESNGQRSLTAKVKLDSQTISKLLPDGIHIAGYDSEDSVTIAGPYKEMMKLLNCLKNENVRVKLIDGCNAPLHTPNMKFLADVAMDILQQIIPVPKLRSDRWISSSVLPSEESFHVKILSCPRYFLRSLCSPVLFKDAVGKIPTGSVVVEMGTNSDLKELIKRENRNVDYVSVRQIDENCNEVVHDPFKMLYELGCVQVNSTPSNAVANSECQKSCSGYAMKRHSLPNLVFI